MRSCSSWPRKPRFATLESRLQHGDALDAKLAELLKSQTRETWIERFSEAKILCGPVYTYADLFADPQFQHNQMATELTTPDGNPMKLISSPIHLAATPGKLRSTPPELGQHTDTILQHLGYADGDIQQLRKQQVVL